MGNYFSAWDAMMDRWIAVWDNSVVLSSENPALTWNYQMNKHDGAGLSWDVNRLSALNELEFCSMLGHDSDVRVFLYPIIEERYAVIMDTFARAEFEWDAYDAADFHLWNDQDMFDMWEIWRMCHDEASTYAASRAEICNNFGMAGNDEHMGDLIDIFVPTGQRELTQTSDFKYEAIKFREFATRLYAVMYVNENETKEEGSQVKDSEKENEGEEEAKTEAESTEERHHEEQPEQRRGNALTREFLEELLLDIRMRRQALPYRCRALFHMF